MLMGSVGQELERTQWGSSSLLHNIWAFHKETQMAGYNLKNLFTKKRIKQWSFFSIVLFHECIIKKPVITKKHITPTEPSVKNNKKKGK